MRSRSTILALLLAAAAGPLAACDWGGSDKAGGVSTPVTLRIAAHEEHDYFATLFTDEVRRLSKGHIRVEFLPGNGDNDPADAVVRFARQVGDGRYDLGVIDAPAWDELGVKSLEPLQAPFLISDQSLFRAVVASPLANRMLAGLRAQHVVGLSLMMSWLEHPMGYEGPLTTPADFRGKRIRVPVSRLNDAVISALGATPMHLGSAQVGPSVARHELDGEEMITPGPPHTWLTANVTLFADALTVVVNERRYAKLSDQQRRVLRIAAARAAQRSAAVMAANSEAKLAPRQCARGRVVLAGGADRATLEQATRPVYAQLEHDPQVKATIGAIRELERRTPPDPAPRIPTSCSRIGSAVHARERDPSFLDGSYRWRITRAGARKVGVDPDDAAVGTIAGMTLRGGGWALERSDGSRDRGTFTVVGNRIAFDWPAQGYTNSFTFKRRSDGTLELTPVLPMDAGDRLVVASSPWKRIGPPVRKVP
jgi:TRAP-type C4-dicarboxylate transport system substrate-binding protein